MRDFHFPIGTFQTPAEECCTPGSARARGLRFLVRKADGDDSEDCLICNKEPKAGATILLVRTRSCDLYYCTPCIRRAAAALGLTRGRARPTGRTK